MTNRNTIKNKKYKSYLVFVVIFHNFWVIKNIIIEIEHFEKLVR